MCDYCAWIEKILRPSRLQALPTICANIPDKPKTPVQYDRTILVHGSADSASSREEIKGILKSIEKAATEAYKELAKGCESVDAVELAIRYLENETRKENNECVIGDAAIMDSDSNAGSVGAVTGILHSITLAKRVMQKTDHVLIVETGAHKLESESSETESSDRIATVSENRFSQNNEMDTMASGKFLETPKKWRKIYGAIARDRKGQLACGVSTMNNRKANIKERSSMSAVGTVLGCGIFADEEFCCSVSGEDRAIYLYAPARKIIKRLKREREIKGNNEVVRVEEALNEELTNFFKETGESCIGAAALSIEGKPEVAFTSHYFPWSYCSNGIVTSGGIDDEIFTKEIELDMPLDCECHH